jgi:acetoin utilization deacetylase AcuC-like enzyme/formylglycine-generating enzyme required for sulfatase activity
MRWVLPALGILLFVSCEKSGAPGPAGGKRQVLKTATGVEMVLVPAGQFRMGSTHGNPDETPVHLIHLDAFWMDRHEVTQAEYEKLGFSNPSRFKGLDLPMEMMTWTKAAMFANARSKAEGLKPCYDEDNAQCDFEASGYRLPTEAEWEYACRAGTETEYAFGGDPRLLSQYAWYAENSAKLTHPVKQKKPNAWGLYDMLGNVAEWTNDAYDKGYYLESRAENPRGPVDGDLYVIRGGAWSTSAEACRSAARDRERPGFADACLAPDALGFRLVRRADNPPGQPKAKGSEKPQQDLPEKVPDDPEKASEDPPEKVPEKSPEKTGFIFRDIFLEHRTGEGFPERPDRLRAIVGRLEQDGLLRQLARIEPKADPGEWIARIHSTAYMERVRKACEACGDRIDHLDSSDVPISSQSYNAAVAAAGAVLDAVDAVMDGRIRNCFCAVRPPGHHALKERAMGFCIFNNVAIAARYLREKHRVERVLIVDWDVHHGNGTQDAFYSDPSVFYFSTHLSPHYPGSGSESEKGEGAGLGTKINVPLPRGAGDAEMARAYDEKLEPAARAFRPGFVLISAGFDSHRGDPLGGLEATAPGYAALTRRVKAIADRSARGRVVSVLEGGYDLAAISESAEAHVRALME